MNYERKVQYWQLIGIHKPISSYFDKTSTFPLAWPRTQAFSLYYLSLAVHYNAGKGLVKFTMCSDVPGCEWHISSVALQL